MGEGGGEDAKSLPHYQTLVVTEMQRESGRSFKGSTSAVVCFLLIFFWIMFATSCIVAQWNFEGLKLTLSGLTRRRLGNSSMMSMQRKDREGTSVCGD